MRTQTVEQTIYSYSDLLLAENDSLLRKIISEFIDGNEYSYIWSEAENTVDKFNDVFDLKSGLHSWLDFNSNCSNNAYQYDLMGIRLRTFIINNYYSHLYSAKTYRKFGYDWNKKRLSKLFKTNCCELTGVCYDDDILKPVYKFIEKYDNSMDEVTFEDLITDCYKSLRKSIENEIEYRESDEAILETIEANCYEFDEYGNII
jgi:hypothetical protein